ncbi:unnamed protein product, partial [Ascophyllum nodosum]
IAAGYGSELNFIGIVLFESNHAFDDGGAIYLDDSSKLHATKGGNVSFFNNHAGIDGGAIHADYGSDVSFEGETVFANNTAIQAQYTCLSAAIYTSRKEEASLFPTTMLVLWEARYSSDTAASSMSRKEEAYIFSTTMLVLMEARYTWNRGASYMSTGLRLLLETRQPTMEVLSPSLTTAMLHSEGRHCSLTTLLKME